MNQLGTYRVSLEILLPCFKVTYSRLLIDESAVDVGVCLNDWLTFNSTVMMPMGHSDFVA